jgi:hypothetical protein
MSITEKQKNNFLELMEKTNDIDTMYNILTDLTMQYNIDAGDLPNWVKIITSARIQQRTPLSSEELGSLKQDISSLASTSGGKRRLRQRKRKTQRRRRGRQSSRTRRHK